MKSHFTTTRPIAEALRSLADQFDTDDTVAEVWVHVGCQVVRDENPDERIATVDRLRALLALPAASAGGSTIYGTGKAINPASGLDVDVYTGVRSQREIELAEEIARLRAELDQANAQPATAPEAGHVYSCCGKVGRISRHQSWCPTNADVAPNAGSAS